MGFTKLFSCIVTSSIWVQDDPVRIVWICMLSLANAAGVVEASIPGLANVARVSLENCRRAIEIFLSPDPDSRNPENEGRRIEICPGGWRILNYVQYRNRRDDELRRQQTREAVARYRGKAREDDPGSASRCKPDVSQGKPRKAHAEAEADKKNTLRDSPNPAVKSFLDFWYRTFLQKFGEPCRLLGAKDGSLVKGLLRDYQPERLKELGEAFFRSSDPFIQKSGYTIGAFSSQINKLICEERRRKTW